MCTISVRFTCSPRILAATMPWVAGGSEGLLVRVHLRALVLALRSLELRGEAVLGLLLQHDVAVIRVRLLEEELHHQVVRQVEGHVLLVRAAARERHDDHHDEQHLVWMFSARSEEW